jgi:hypothetical protein
MFMKITAISEAAAKRGAGGRSGGVCVMTSVIGATPWLGKSTVDGLRDGFFMR